VQRILNQVPINNNIIIKSDKECGSSLWGYGIALLLPAFILPLALDLTMCKMRKKVKEE